VSEIAATDADELRALTARVRYLEAKVAFLRHHACELAEAQAARHTVSRDDQSMHASELARLREQNRILEETLAAIRRTMSWRATAPLRYVRRLQIRLTRS
jgi:uncharacterized protein YigA (DUF484 family)